ncbi:MAG: sigma-70 family RNA polymerase sigma factor [Myxococcota bacterium]
MKNLDVYLPAIASGDSQSFARWMADAEPPLRRSLGRFAAQVDVEAVLQETLLRVWQVAPRFQADGRENGLLRLGHRIGRNLCISELRRRGKEPASLTEDPAAVAHEPDPLLRETIVRCREKLPPKPKAALNARMEAAGGEADFTTAARLGMKKNTFLQNLTRARKLLEACLRKYGVELREAWS